MTTEGAGQQIAGRQTRHWMDLLASFAMIIASAVLMFAALGKPAVKSPRVRNVPLPLEPLEISGLPAVGSLSAPLAIVAFSDFQCPYCGAFARDTYPRIRREFIDSGQALFVFRQLPLTTIHPLARRAAASSVCASRQSAFERMHDSLFAIPSRLDEQSLFGRAVELGLDQNAFRKCMDAPDDAVALDVAAARQLGITSTPTFLVGALLAGQRVKVLRVLSGAQGLDEFKAVVRTIQTPAETTTQ